MPEKRFKPETVTVRDYRFGDRLCSPEPAAKLAKDILDGTGLSIVSIRLHYPKHSVTEMVFRLSPQHQGKNMETTLLRSAELNLGTGTAVSWWTEQILYHAPKFEELELLYSSCRNPWDQMFTHGQPTVQLKRFELWKSRLSAETIICMLNNSQETLISILQRHTTE